MELFTLDVFAQMQEFAQGQEDKGCKSKFARVPTRQDPDADSIFVGDFGPIGKKQTSGPYHIDLANRAGIPQWKLNAIQEDGKGLENADMGIVQYTLDNNTLSFIGNSEGFSWVGETERATTVVKAGRVIDGRANVVGEWPNIKSR